MSFYDSSSSVQSLPRLLLPTVRNPRLNPPTSPPSVHKSPKIKSPPSRSSRSRLASPQLTLDPRDSLITIGQLWLGKDADFEIVHDQLELDGFQLFAVEKWFVRSLVISQESNSTKPRVTERKRSIVTLTVYTGDPLDKVTRKTTV
jgi:hypothetical protein